MRGGEHVHARVLGPNLSETIDIAEIDRCNAADKPDEREALDRRLAVKFDLDPVGAGTRAYLVVEPERRPEASSLPAVLKRTLDAARPSQQRAGALDVSREHERKNFV